MTGLYIALGIVLLLVLLALLPVSVGLEYDGGFRARVRVGCMRVYGYPRAAKRRKKEDENSPKGERRAKKKKKADAAGGKDGAKKGAGGKDGSGKKKKLTPGAVLEICRLAKEAIRRMKLRLRVKRLECRIVYGSADAAQTAITYGRINAAVYSLIGFAGNYLSLDNIGVDIRPDFESARFLFCGKVEIAGRVGNILLAFFNVLVYLYSVRDSIKNIIQ